MSVQSVTFPATTNAVSASTVKQPTLPILKVIESHEAFSAAFQSNDEPDMKALFAARNKKTAPNATIIQASSMTGEMLPCPSGLVSAVLEAYNRHHNLILRPDDVWQAVLTQFSLYLMANAEELRDQIVDFQGQRQLTVKALGTLFTADFGEMANQMVDEEIITNIKDPKLVPWLLPSFTTTTPTDRVAASVSVMSAMQKYFKYKFELSCGIPSVTLLGTPEDWMKLRAKFDGLLQFELPGSTHMQEWHGWLSDIGDNLVESAKGNADVKFWDRVASHKGGGSGPRYVSGWIAAFAVWSDDGKWQGANRRPVGGATYMVDSNGKHVSHYTSDFPIINTNDLSSGVVSVPVLADDNGKEYDCHMLSGQFGMHVDGDTVSPRTDWCIATELNEKLPA